MSQNTLIEKINTDTETTIASINEKRAADVAAIEAETTAQLTELQAEHDRALEKSLAHLELVATSQAKREGNIALQKAKRDQIEAVFTTVLTDIVGLSSADYVTFFTKKAQEIIPKDASVESVVTAKDRTEDTEKILKECGLSGSVSEDNTVSAGFIVHATDGVYDVTLERLFAEQRAELEMEIVKRLA